MVQQPTRSVVGQVVPGVPPFDVHACWAADASDDGTLVTVHCPIEG